MDRDIAERMRCENFEQFQTLVRMHLSFELDLNTDPVDEVLHNVKLKTKKLFAFPKKSKHFYSHSSKITNPPFNVAQTLSPVGIEQIKQMISFLLQDQNIIQEGIFRRTGSVARQNELRRRLNDQATLDFSDGVYNVHDCASVLKSIIADLPEPLLTDNFYAVHCQIAELCNNNNVDCNQTKEIRLLQSIQLLLLLLPLENRSLFHDIIYMLNETIKYEANNKMSSESLATLFTPHLICPRKLTPEALHSISQNMSGMISFMITKGDELQNIPPKLATDIHAYFLEQKRKRILSPDVQVLDESVTSDSTANTVYTFIDREKTAEAHISNPTDTALAQLYAYIQTLPESSKKRKLIKQFNKENGQGTPLQQQMMMRLKKGNGTAQRPNKSISGSIKKHIFHTTGSKTPKRAPSIVATVTAASTPINRRVFETNLKPRLVFQTPNQSKLSVDLSTSNTTPISLPPIQIAQSNPPILVSLPSTEIDNRTATIEMASNDGLASDKQSEKKQNNSKCDSGTHQTPTSFNMNKFITCFKSEPNLSKALTDKHDDNVPMLNRGRFIAKKLLSGVSMVNLKLPFSSSHDKIDLPKNADFTPKTTKDNFLTGGDMGQGKKIVFDESTELNTSCDEKENQLPMATNDGDHSIYAQKSKQSLNLTNCGHLSDSVSPITKSTHRMSKAMQESIMTPRSRKPVIIGAMLGINTDNYHKKFMNFPIDDEETDFDMDRDNNHLLNSSLHKSKSENDLMLALTSNSTTPLLQPVELLALKITNSTSEETLSTPFRRSLLMTTPMDSSFSSQSDDFENLNDSEMSESLIYCLNGNEPEVYLTPNSSNKSSAVTIAAGRCIGNSATNSTSSSIKRPHTNIGNLSDSTSSLTDKIYSDFNCINPKKNHLELDETAL